ncbi:MAG: hypothetical protein JW798_15145 [Prolixibacteraceae bacterium]|nr:hypothetical protein [Prolixibacteraceae bacterium]MBN2819760.1 hypothetical protein [Bacteroidales bacterium]
MAFRSKDYIKALTAIVFLLLSGFTKVWPDFPHEGLRDMKGTLVHHIFESETDSLSDPEIVELQDENGLPIWFSRQFHKDVCITGECKMIRVTLFWDGSGNYLGMEIPEDQPLTKSDHTEFDAGDYEKLNAILSNTASILKDLKLEELIVVPDSIDPYTAYKIDGYTAATQPALAEVVVKDAAYTCYTLWHTVYGPSQTKILEILDERVCADFLKRMFESQETKKILWGIRAVEKRPSYHEDFYPLFIQYIRSDTIEISQRALLYFQSSKLKDASLQKQLVEVMFGLSTEKKNTIIWKLIESGYATEEVIFELLTLFQEQQLNSGSLNLIYRLIRSEHLQNQQIMLVLESLSKHKDAYVRNLTGKLLAKYE